MIVCVCNSISNTDPITRIRYICGKCKSSTCFMSNILKKYKSITLHHEEKDNVQIYTIYDGYSLKEEFSSVDTSAYKKAMECFTKLKNEN